jgi:hypothetical protein
VVNDELDDLDRQRVSIKERRMLSRRKRKTRRKQSKLRIAHNFTDELSDI